MRSISSHATFTGKAHARAQEGRSCLGQQSGTTDRLGTAVANQKLSEQRAEAVRKHLVSRGLPAEIIHASGAGSARPLVQCATTRSRQAQVECLQPNRRVELIIQGAMQ